MRGEFTAHPTCNTPTSVFELLTVTLRISAAKPRSRLIPAKKSIPGRVHPRANTTCRHIMLHTRYVVLKSQHVDISGTIRARACAHSRTSMYGTALGDFVARGLSSHFSWKRRPLVSPPAPETTQPCLPFLPVSPFQRSVKTRAASLPPAPSPR